ncbi:MAG: hypothetical protein FWB91_03445 [Defluviitaleaceae bacterium]|nr:hypothetical protein [Defluviitaleaceae bacterium]
MLRPIDMTLTIQHAADAHRAGSGDANAARPEVAGQMFADRLEKQAKLLEKQVNQTDQSEKKDVNPERQGHGGGYQPNRKPKQKKASAPANQNKPIGESMYDIRV